MKKIMLIAEKSSEVRSNWSEFVDNVLHKTPKFVQRNDRDVFMSANFEFLSLILEKYRYTLEIEHDLETDEFVVSMPGCWVVESGSTKEEAINAYFAQYVDFASDLFSNPTELNAPNMKEQYPYLLKAIILNDIERLMQYTDVKYVRP